jgi:hypothetical protein
MKKYISFIDLTAFSILTIISIVYVIKNGAVTVDDAFIIFRVAENYAQKGKLLFNMSDGHLTVTTPLYTVFLALLMKITDLSIVNLAFYSGIFSMTISSLFLFLTFKKSAPL